MHGLTERATKQQMIEALDDGSEVSQGQPDVNVILWGLSLIEMLRCHPMGSVFD